MTIDHLLLVDDDKEIRELLSQYLTKQGYKVSTLATGEHLLETVQEKAIQLVILDVMLPKKDGLELCRELRAYSQVPIIMLTARGEDTDKIVGLEMGADDYLPKPFNPRELLARIKAVLKRVKRSYAQQNLEDEDYLMFDNWVLDKAVMQLIAPDASIRSLSGAEFRLLEVFLNHPNRILSRDFILNHVKGRDAHPFDRSIDVQISRLRQRLNHPQCDGEIIKTIRGEGYMLTVKVSKLDRKPESKS